MWIIPEQFITRTVIFLKISSSKSLLSYLFASMIKEVATPSQRTLPTSLSYFTQEIGFWKWFSMTTSEIDLNFKWAISLILHKNSSTVTVVTIKNWSHQPSCNQFPKAPQASSMLILSSKSNVCLAFFFCQEQGYCQFQIKSDHMRIIFRSVLHGLLWAYALRQALSSDNLQRTSHSWKDFSEMERQDYHRMESNSSPSNRPESTPEMVGLTMETCVTPSVR